MRRNRWLFAALLTILPWVTTCGEGNPPLTVGTIPSQTVAVGETAVVDVSQYFSDADGDVLDFSAETSDRAVATVSVSGSAATIRGVGKGIAVITVTATDPEGLSARQNFNATVPNRPPFVRDPLPAVEVKPADSATVNLAVYFDDPDGDSLIFSTETSDEAVASASVSGSVMTVAGIAKGKAEIAVTAADPDGLAVGQTFDVDVPNQPPVIRDSIPALEMNPGDSATVDLAAHFEDPDGDSLIFAAGTSDEAVARASVFGSVMTVAAVAKGKAEITVTAGDPEGLDVVQSFNANVLNQPPVAVDSLRALELLLRDSVLVDLTMLFEDPDGDSLSFAVETSDSATVGVSLAAGTMAIRALDYGTATVSATATDTEGLSAMLATTMTVINLPPEIVDPIEPRTIRELGTVTVVLHEYFRDPEGGDLTYAATVSDPELVTATTSDSAVTVKGVSEGEVVVTVTATDPGGLSAEQDIEVTVEALTDREVLEAIYHAMGGPNWRKSANWLSDRPLRSWEGVSVDENGGVRILNLHSNYLIGALPPEIGYLSSLNVYLRLSQNSITSIPPEIGRLHRLRELHLGSNRLRELPPEIGGLGSLESLYLQINQLRELPPEIGKLSSLEDLYLVGNQLQELPREIANLTNLRLLGLGYNRITSIPVRVLRHLANLEDLYLYNNQLSGPIPPEIANLGSLRRLWLVNNKLTGPIPAELGSLTNVEDLLLHGNRLTGPIPEELGSLESLERLYLGGGNQLTGPIPPELGNLPKLLALYLNRNELTGSIPPELGNLSSLQTLRLNGNQLSGTIPPELGNLTSLGVSGYTSGGGLFLGNNNLSGPIPIELSKLDSAQTLSLGHNNLTGPVPEGIGSLGNLRRLDLADNPEMSGELPDTLTNLHLLEEFFAGGTDLCATRDPDFQRWLNGIRRQRVAQCPEEGTSAAYLTQAVQSLRFPVPLVADEKALLRVFITAKDAGDTKIPPVVARFYVDGEETHVAEIPEGTDSIPPEIDEGNLDASANALIPADVVQPGLEMVVEIDPDETLDPDLGVTKRIPAEGRLKIDVQEMPPLSVTLIPFLWEEDPDSAILDVVKGSAKDPMGHELLWGTRTLLPVRDLEVEGHEPVWTSSNADWFLAARAAAIRAMEGSRDFYVAMLSGTSTGSRWGSYGFYGDSSGFAIPKSGALAHTIGHFVLWHAPCGFGWQLDPDFPQDDGSIGAWGYDFRNGGSLVKPTQPDLMSACDNRWISDYHFSHALRGRLEDEPEPRAPPTTPVKSLLLWGGVDAKGAPYLEPAFVVDAPTTLPQSPGDHEIMGRTAGGDTLFVLNFDPAEAGGGHSESGFVFLLPVGPQWAGQLAKITLSGPGGQATLDGDTDRPMIILRNPETGAIRGILQGVPAETLARGGPAALLSANPELQVLTSRGIPDAAAWLR